MTKPKDLDQKIEEWDSSVYLHQEWPHECIGFIDSLIVDRERLKEALFEAMTSLKVIEASAVASPEKRAFKTLEVIEVILHRKQKVLEILGR